MLTNTIKAHADRLRNTEPDKYKRFRQELVGIGEEVYFDNTLCRTRNDKPCYDLRQVRFIVADLICKHIPGFTDENFRKNELPELPAVLEKATI